MIDDGDLFRSAGRSLAGDGVHMELRTLAVTGATIVAPLLLGLGASAPVVTCEVVRGSDMIHVSSVTPQAPGPPPAGTATKKSKAAAASSSREQSRTINVTASLSRVASIVREEEEASAPLHAPAAVSAGLQTLLRRSLDTVSALGGADRGCAALAVDPRTHGAGYVTHPAAMDASMHIDAALAEVRFSAGALPVARPSQRCIRDFSLSDEPGSHVGHTRRFASWSHALL